VKPQINYHKKCCLNKLNKTKLQVTSCTYSLCAQLEVEEMEGAFNASKYRIKVAQLKITGNHKMEAIS